MGAAVYCGRVARWEGSSPAGAASVYPDQRGSRREAQFLSFQKIGSQPGKVSFLLPETEVVMHLVFLSTYPNLPTKLL